HRRLGVEPVLPQAPRVPGAALDLPHHLFPERSGAGRHRRRGRRAGAGPVAAEARTGVRWAGHGSERPTGPTAARGAEREMTTQKAADAGRRVDTIENRWSTDQLMTGIRFGPWLKLLQKNHFKF